LLILTLLLAASELTAVQQSGTQNVPVTEFLNTKVPEFDLQNQTIVDGVWKLARAPEPFAFGFENVLKKTLRDPDVPDPRFILQLKDKTVREVLDALCQEDSRFTWSMDGTTVNVFPRVIINDGSYLLNRKLERYDLKNATDVDKGLFAMARELPPPFEQIAHAQAGGGDPYPPEPWTVTSTILRFDKWSIVSHCTEARVVYGFSAALKTSGHSDSLIHTCIATSRNPSSLATF
jgi:hypothetical protein